MIAKASLTSPGRASRTTMLAAVLVGAAVQLEPGTAVQASKAARVAAPRPGKAALRSTR
ncbi:MAG: hypothetical protein IPI43_30060 [Sandaracinaceae bacterium]|nr:hypothetical protein [Sandaracinaceae bacterium]